MMNFKIFALSTFLFAGNVAAQMPECTVGTDTESCVTPMGQDGYFICPAAEQIADQVQQQISNLRPNLPEAVHGVLDELDEELERPRLPGLSRAKCMPNNLPPELEDMMQGPFGGNGGGPFGGGSTTQVARQGGGLGDIFGADGPFGGFLTLPRMECGCCGADCPTPVDCGCPCEINLPYGAVIQGTKANVTGVDGTETTRCVPPAYADPDQYTCVTDCSVEVESPFPFV